MYFDDSRWVHLTVSRLPAKYRMAALEGYEKVYKKAFESEKTAYKKTCTARLEANTRLRSYCKEIHNIYNKHRKLER